MQARAMVCAVLILVFLLVSAVSAEDALEWYTKGQNAAKSGNYADAVTYYDNAVSVDSNYATAYAGKAIALNALGQYSAALDAANKALSIRTLSDALGARANALYNLGQYNDAIAAYVNYTARVTNQADAYCNLADAYVQVNRSDQAVIAYAKCTNLNSIDPLIWNRMGLAYMNLGQYSDALTAFNKATTLTVSNPEIWNNKGLALVALGQYQDSVSCFDYALSLNPSYAAALANKNAALGKGQYYNYSATAKATIEPWYLGGVKPTIVTATPTTTVTAAESSLQVTETTLISTQVTDIPETTRTTYSPVSPWVSLAGILGAALIVNGFGKKKNP